MGLKPRVKWASGRETGAVDREEKSTGPKPKTTNTESGFRTETAAKRKPKSRGTELGAKNENKQND
jgi:hypothetical protein